MVIEEGYQVIKIGIVREVLFNCGLTRLINIELHELTRIKYPMGLFYADCYYEVILW